ncbi:hypothetical protein BD413DRAFT_655212, partial [Trametes elegans]
QIPTRQSSFSSLCSDLPQSHPNSHNLAQIRGFDAVEEAERKLRAKAAATNAASALQRLASHDARSESATSESAVETNEEREQRLRAEDEAAVKAELSRYKQDLLQDRRVDLLRFWQVQLLLIKTWDDTDSWYRSMPKTTHTCSASRSTSCPFPRRACHVSACFHRAKRWTRSGGLD